MEYDELLKRAYENLPKKTLEHERFEVPQADVLIQGNKTVIRNFTSICEKLNRDPKHLSKYLFKELATSGLIEGQRLILNSKFAEKTINSKINEYVKDFVLCKQCNRPDTKIVEYERGIFMMVCEACGARSPVPKI